MNTLLIECFRAATETLNFTVAAQKIHMSQPAFSRNIAALEEEVGFKLFWRSKQNGSRLTPAGAALYNGLFDIEQQYNDLLEKANKSFNDAAGVLRGGNGKHSIARKGQELAELGVKLKKRLAVPKRFQGDDTALEDCSDAIEVSSGEDDNSTNI